MSDPEFAAQLARVRELLSGHDSLAPGFTVPSFNLPYHIGTVAPVIGGRGLQQLNSGLYVPTGVSAEPQPLDNLLRYLRLSDVSDHRVDLRQVRLILSRLPLKESLSAVMQTLNAMRLPGVSTSEKMRELDQASIDFFTEPMKSRLKNRISEGYGIHAPQLMMVLAKLIIAHCPFVAKPAFDISVPHLLLMVADNLDTAGDRLEQGEIISLDSEIAVEFTANHHFNASVRIDSMMALFQRRWLEMPSEKPSPHYAVPLEEVFEDATDINLRDRTAAAFAIYSSLGQSPTVNVHAMLQSLGWSDERIVRAIEHLSLPAKLYKPKILEELRDHSIDWYFTAFEQFPLIKFNDEWIVLDADNLLNRCISFFPFLDIRFALEATKRTSNLIRIRRAVDDYSERYVVDAFKSISGNAARPKRIYGGKEIESAYKRKKAADLAMDYGDAWVVVEVSTRSLSRDSVNGVSGDGLRKDRDAVVEEAKQVAGTIRAIRSDSSRLTRVKSTVARYYPVVVFTEGFPANPIMTSIVRDHLRAENVLQAADVAPLEILDVEELDMIEGVAEQNGKSLPFILSAKERSHFHADSVRNFLLADHRFDPARPQRVETAFKQMWSEILERLRPGQ